MKRNIAFSILIMAVFIQIAFSNAEESIIYDTSLLKFETVQNLLDVKEVVVRVYNDWKSEIIWS